MDDADETMPATGADIETDVKEMMGLFDLPAFARRGQELEFMLRRLQDRCRTAPPVSCSTWCGCGSASGRPP